MLGYALYSHRSESRMWLLGFYKMVVSREAFLNLGQTSVSTVKANKIQTTIDLAFREEKRLKSSFTSLLHILAYLILTATSSQARRGLIDI